MKILAEVVKIYDIEPFDPIDGDTYRFRLEIMRNLDTDAYYGIVHRLETYRLQPTFPQTENGCPVEFQHDALIYVSDDTFSGIELNGNSTQEVVEKFKESFNYFFIEQIKNCSMSGE